MPSTRRDGGGDLTGVYRAHIMDDRERTRRQLALETKRRQKLFEEKAKRRQMEEEKLVRLARAWCVDFDNLHALPRRGE